MHSPPAAPRFYSLCPREREQRAERRDQETGPNGTDLNRQPINFVIPAKAHCCPGKIAARTFKALIHMVCKPKAFATESHSKFSSSRRPSTAEWLVKPGSIFQMSKIKMDPGLTSHSAVEGRRDDEITGHFWVSREPECHCGSTCVSQWAASQKFPRTAVSLRWDDSVESVPFEAGPFFRAGVESTMYDRYPKPRMRNRPALVGLILLMVLASPAVPALDAQQEPNVLLGRTVLRELIETDTTPAHGSTTAAAEKMASRFLAAGFPAADVLVLGPLEAVEGKNPPLSDASFADCVATAVQPVLALGGIRTSLEVRRALRLGAHGIAVQRAFSHAPHGGEALSTWLQHLNEARANGVLSTKLRP